MKHTIIAAVFAASTSPALLANAAEDTGSSERSVPVAPVDAWELTVGQGYNQGVGEAVRDELALGDLGRGGPSLQLGLGYRMDPRWLAGVYAEGARYLPAGGVPDHTEVYSSAFGLQANFHFMPFSSVDPWIAFGTGFRAYWVNRERMRTESLHGLDLVRLRLGADYQLGPSTRIGPMLGATLTTFHLHRGPADSGFESIDHPTLSTFVFAGLQGRFEIGGERITENQARIARR